MCLNAKLADTLHFMDKHKHDEYITVYKLVSLIEPQSNSPGFRSPFMAKKYSPGWNYADIELPLITEDKSILNGLHVFIEHNATIVWARDETLLPCQAYLSDLIGVDYNVKHAAFRKLYIDLEIYNKYLFGVREKWARFYRPQFSVIPT